MSIKSKIWKVNRAVELIYYCEILSTLKPSGRSRTSLCLCDGFILLLVWWINIPTLVTLIRNYHNIFCVGDKSRDVLKIHLGLALTQKS